MKSPEEVITKRALKITAAAALIVFVLSAAVMITTAEQNFQPAGTNLKFSPAPRTSISYGIQATLNGDGQDFLGESLKVEIRAQGQVDLKILDSPPDLVRTSMTVPGIEIDARMPGSDLHGTIRTRQNEVLEVVFNSTGKVSEIRNADVVEQDFESNISFNQIINDYFPVLPAGPVRPGESWYDTRNLRFPFRGTYLDVILRTEYRLDDVLPSPDGPMAFITTLYTAEVKGEIALDQGSGVFEGQGGGSGFLHFLVDKGFFSGYQTSFSVQARFLVKKGNEVLLSWPFSFESFSLITLNRFEPPAIP